MSKQSSAGLLRLEGERGLAFEPHVFPSVRIRSVGFTRWSEVDGAWYQPYGHVDEETVRRLQELFGTITIDPAVLQVLHPPVKKLPSWIAKHEVLFPHQKDAIAYALNHPRALIALAPGLGKTAVSIAALKAVNAQRILVVAPLTLLYNWRNEIYQWLGKSQTVVFCHSRNLLLPARWTLTNYETVRLHPDRFTKVKWDAIIVDESLMVKNRKAKRTQAVKRVVTKAKPPYLWLLSGAPTSRFNDDLWAQLNLLAPSRYSSYWRFVERVCWIDKNQWGWNITDDKLSIEELQRDLNDVFFARTQDQVLDLPPWIFNDYPVEMTKRQSALYFKMEQEFIAQLDEYDDSTVIGAANILAQTVRLLQLASNPALIGGPDVAPKWDAVAEGMEYEAAPYLVWDLFIETGDRLKARLTSSHTVEVLNGAVAPKRRQEIVEAYQRGDIEVLIAHPKVGKYGLTLTAARTVYYLERSWDADDYYQSLFRVRRIGTTHSPHVIHLLAVKTDGSGTVDHLVNAVLKARKEKIIKLTTGELKRFIKEMS